MGAKRICAYEVMDQPREIEQLVAYHIVYSNYMIARCSDRLVVNPVRVQVDPEKSFRQVDPEKSFRQ